MRDETTSALLFIGFQVLYGTFVFSSFPLIGDAADYASLIAHATFDHQTTHVGFYVAHYPLHLLNRELIGLDADLFLNLVTTTFGALSVPLVYWILRDLLTNGSPSIRRVPLYGAVIYGLSGLVWFYVEFAEVQALMLLLLYVSFLFFLKGRYGSAGFSLALSALVSPAVAPCGAWFLAVAAVRRVRLRSLVTFSAVFAGTLVVCILPVYEDFFWGPRGIIQLEETFPPTAFSKATAMLVYTVLESFWLLILLAVFALPELRRQRELFWLSIASVPPFVFLGSRLGMGDYGVVFQPVLFPVAAWIALGFVAAMRRFPRSVEAVAAPCALAAFLATTLYTYVLPKMGDAASGNECLERTHQLTGGGYVITDPYVGFVYAHTYWPDHAVVWDAPWTAPKEIVESIERVAREPGVFVLDNVPSSHFLRSALLSNSLASRVFSEEQRTQYLVEFDLVSDEVTSLVPKERLESVMTCGPLELWRFAGVR